MSPVFSMTGMEGLEFVTVLVETASFGGPATSAVENQMKTQTELYLRGMPGLRVTDEARHTPAVLHVSLTCGDVNVAPGGPAIGYGASLTLELRQAATLSRSQNGREIFVPEAVTWMDGYTLTVDTSAHGLDDAVRRGLQQCLDKFRKEYLKANPGADT
jgi:hypothetical protein